MRANTPATRRAATVLVPAACLVIVAGIAFWGGGRPTLAAAIERLREADTIVCRVTLTMNAMMRPVGGPESTGGLEPMQTTHTRTEKLAIRAQQGLRRDAFDDDKPVSTTIVALDGTTLILDHMNRTFTRVEPESQNANTDDLTRSLADLAADRPLAGLSPFGTAANVAHVLDTVRRLATTSGEEIGRSVIDGQEAVGYAIDADKVGLGPPFYDKRPDSRAELWVDAEEGHPVRLVLHVTTAVGSLRDLPLETTFEFTAVYDRFELDKPVDDDLFRMVVPEGYVPSEAFSATPLELPDKAAFVEALRAFADAAGRYPGSLCINSAMHEVSFLIGALQGRRAAARANGASIDDIPDSAALGKRLYGLLYYAVLSASGADPVYFGTTVEPGDAEHVLIRWTTETGGTVLIYGDLHEQTKP